MNHLNDRTTGRDHLPDFIIIGAAKAGTTSLAEYLANRPDVFLTTPKEIEFFARDDLYEKGLDHYRGFFAQAQDGQLRGEASTLYSLAPHFPQTARRIADAVPDVRLIYVLREPVERAYSYYVQLQKNYRRSSRDTRIHRSFEDFLNPDSARAPRDKALAAYDAHLPDVPGLVIDGSDYLLQIRSYLEYFDRDQILFLPFEELRADPGAVFARIHAFLGLPPPDPDAALPRANISQSDFRKLETDAIAAQISGRYSLLRKMAQILLPRPLRQKLRASLVSLLQSRRGKRSDPGMPPPMRQDTRQQLSARFHRDRAELSRLTGLDLDRWWGKPQP